jgi:amino acid adenylation domain-containing protein
MAPRLGQWGITRLHLVPTLARSWLRTAPPTPLDALRSVFFAGEPLTDSLASGFRTHFPGEFEVLNFYGPSETTQTKIFHRVPAVPDAGVQPIGRPLPDTAVTLLNRAGVPCGLGEAGEIVIRTPFATRGYMNAPDDQSARFVPDPLGSGESVFRSGDIGRARLDGVIEILGRGDGQVKVRGVTVHPSEISDLLENLPGVRQAAVMAERLEGGDHRLLAWFAADRPWEALRMELADRLPAALVPEFALQLEALPTHPNGKIDIRSLPKPELARAAIPESPQDELESEVLRIWRDVLEQPALDLDARFLESGGQSLKALELVDAVRRSFGREVSPMLLLQDGTPRSMLRALASAPPVTIGLPKVELDPDGASEPFPMTRVQEAYWVGRREFLTLGSAAAQTYRELRCSPDLDLERLERAFDTLIKRHPMLRAVATADGRQRIQPHGLPFRIPIQDLRGAADPAGAMLAWRGEMSHSVRDLESGPLIEMRASRLEDEVRLHFGIDAFVCDAWSRVLLLEELHVLMQSPEASLAPLELTFRDYVRASERVSRERAWAWWGERLDDLPPPPRLPLSHTPGGSFVRRHDRLDAGQWARFQERARSAGVTASAALLAAFGWILSRWSAQDDLTVNVTAFQRLPIHPDVNRLIGDFTTVLPHTVEADWTSFRRHARAEQARLWRELANAEVSGVDLAREMARRSGRIDPTGFPVVFTSALTTPELAREFDWSWLGELVHGISQTPQVWLDLQVYEHRGELHYNWDSIDDLFLPGAPDAMFEAWRRLIGSLVETAWDEAPGELIPSEHLEMIARINATAQPASDETLVDGARKAVERTPDHPAIIDPDGAISYRDLVAGSERVAAALLDAALPRNAIVAILAPHGRHQAVAALGVLTAGCAYLPISIDQPAARIEQILAEANAAAILRAGESWSEGIDLTSLPDRRARREPRADDLAYVIYTSGSTGRPNGVMIRHRMAVNTLRDITDRLGLGPDHRSLALSALSFDLSVWDLFGSWRLGAAVVYPASRTDPQTWSRAISGRRVRLWNSTPMMAQMFLDAVESDPDLPAPNGLDRILLSGDTIPVALAGRVRSALPDAALWSLGGATEGSIWSIAYPIRQVAADWTSVPYGRPLANQTIEVLDAQMRPCPEWVAGKIYIGGEGVAEGYLNNPVLTQQKFVLRGESRLYDTGDLGRWRPDGQVEILGRTDSQVKIRGHRVELAEIEAVLEGLADLDRAAVAYHSDGAGPRRMIAFVTPARGALDLQAVRTELSRRLPDYMTPQVWVELSEMPLTANGKLDRAALLRLAPAQRPAPALPPGAQGGVLARAWEAVLGAPPAGPAANFFEAGGDSVSWLRLCAQASREGWRLPAAAISQDATLEGLSAHLEPAAAAAPETEASAPLSPMQSWLVALGLPRHFNQAILLQFRRPILPDNLRRAVVAAAKAHPAFGLVLDGGVQRYRDVVPVWEQEAAFDLSRLEHACRGFDLEGSLLRATAFDDHLLLCAHHLACDAHSWAILVEDIEFALDALELGESPQIPAEALSFAQWCRLAADAPAPPPPRSREPSPRPTRPTSSSRRVLRQTSSWLTGICRRLRCSPEEMLAAAAVSARGRVEGVWETELERNGRSLEGIDCSRTIGWLTALTPLVLTAAPAADVLAQVKIALRDLPLGGLGLAAAHIRSGANLGMVVNPLGGLTEASSPRFRLRRDIDLPVQDAGVDAAHRLRLTLSQYEGRIVADLVHNGEAERLFDALQSALDELDSASASATAVAADFPESDLDADELRSLLAELEP